MCACMLSCFNHAWLCNTMHCSQPGYSVHGILQARILEWIAMPSSIGSSWPGMKPVSLSSPALAGRFFTISTTWEAYVYKWMLFSHCCCSVTKSCLTLGDHMDCSMTGFPVTHHLLKFAQVHVHWISDAIQTSHPLSSSSSAFSLSQHQDLFQWVGCSYPMAKVLELQHQHQSFQWVFRDVFL